MRIARLLLPALILAAAGCGGPEPYHGAYTFSRVDAFMLTKPLTSNTSQTVVGTLSVEAPTANEYKVTMTDSSGMCVLKATPVGMNLSFTAGQTCTFRDGSGNSVTVTLTSGNGSLTTVTPMSDTKLVIDLFYGISGTSGAFAIVGTGTTVITAVAAAH